MEIIIEKDTRTMTDDELIEQLKKDGAADPTAEIGPCPCCSRPAWQGLGETCAVCFWSQDLFDNDEDEWSDMNRCTIRQWRRLFSTGCRHATPEHHGLWWDEYQKNHPGEAEQ